MTIPTCTVLVTTYNRPDALERCLISLFLQSHRPTEIIVCDDGSGAATQQLITRLQASSPVPLGHVWQVDEGFRLSRIRNMGLAAAKGDYIIQIDGDVVVHRHYVADHLRCARAGFFFSGNQYNIPPDITSQLLDNPKASVQSLLQQTSWNWRRMRNLPLQKLMVSFYHWKIDYGYVLGSNMGFWRQDLIYVNGYDEQFSGWGWEDTELALRLINLGCQLRFIRFGAIQYHLAHPKSSRAQEDTNRDRALETIQQKKTICLLGLSQHLQVTKNRHVTVHRV